MGSDDPSMGWSRYCETMRVAHLSPSLFAAVPSASALALAQLMARRVSTSRANNFDEGEAWSAELLAPSHDNVTRVGASVRALPSECWLNGRLASARLPGARTGERYAAILIGRGACFERGAEA